MDSEGKPLERRSSVSGEPSYADESYKLFANAEKCSQCQSLDRTGFPLWLFVAGHRLAGGLRHVHTLVFQLLSDSGVYFVKFPGRTSKKDSDTAEFSISGRIPGMAFAYMSVAASH